MKQTTTLIEVEDLELHLTATRGDQGPTKLDIEVIFAGEWMFDVNNDDFKYPEITNWQQFIAFLLWLKKNAYSDLFKGATRFKNNWNRLLTKLNQQRGLDPLPAKLRQLLLGVREHYVANPSFKIERRRALVSLASDTRFEVTLTFTPRGNKFETSINFVAFDLQTDKRKQLMLRREYNISSYEFLEKQCKEWCEEMKGKPIFGEQEANRMTRIVTNSLKYSREGLTTLLYRLNNNFNL